MIDFTSHSVVVVYKIITPAWELRPCPVPAPKGELPWPYWGQRPGNERDDGLAAVDVWQLTVVWRVIACGTRHRLSTLQARFYSDLPPSNGLIGNIHFVEVSVRRWECFLQHPRSEQLSVVHPDSLSFRYLEALSSDLKIVVVWADHSSPSSVENIWRLITKSLYMRSCAKAQRLLYF